MNEPENRTGWIDRFGDTWVREDDRAGRYGSWWPCTDGPGWDAGERGGLGVPRTWEEAREYGEFTPADPERTAAALAKVRRAVAS